jgi:hypothetical protein
MKCKKYFMIIIITRPFIPIRNITAACLYLMKTTQVISTGLLMLSSEVTQTKPLQTTKAGNITPITMSALTIPLPIVIKKRNCIYGNGKYSGNRLL